MAERKPAGLSVSERDCAHRKEQLLFYQEWDAVLEKAEE